MTQHTLGNAHQNLGDLPAAIACWREAETYYRQMGDVEKKRRRLEDLRLKFWEACCQQA